MFGRTKKRAIEKPVLTNATRPTEFLIASIHRRWPQNVALFMYAGDKTLQKVSPTPTGTTWLQVNMRVVRSKTHNARTSQNMKQWQCRRSGPITQERRKKDFERSYSGNRTDGTSCHRMALHGVVVWVAMGWVPWRTMCFIDP